jgi:hypothetical protein
MCDVFIEKKDEHKKPYDHSDWFGIIILYNVERRER